ncbi:hypothetical protein HQ487_03635, partial [Candidatus Uhrbacteria bacterium]|nr:hypothetical protein [Candidatus Uhrbacteria bacterium]
MTSTTRFLTIALMGFVSTFALAAPMHPTARDNDHDGYPVPTVDVNGDGVVNGVDIGLAKVDCDDFVVSVNPGASERPYDLIDNDCDSTTLDTVPVPEAVWKKFISFDGEYKGNAPTSGVFTYEFDQCTAGAGLTPATCEVDFTDGKFHPADGYMMADVKVNGTDIYRNHGEAPDGRELATRAEYSHFLDIGGSAGGTSSKAKGTGTVVSGTSKAYVDGTYEVAHGEILALREEVLEANASQDEQIAGNTAVGTANNAIIAGIVSSNRSRDELIGQALDASQLNGQAIIALDGRVTDAQRTAGKAAEDANSALSHSPLFEGYLVTGLVMGQQIDDGDNV